MAALDSDLGKALRAARSARKLNQGQLAFRAGVSPITLSRWETGHFRPRLPELEAILTALDATSQERASILALVDAPRAVTKIRTETKAALDETVQAPVIGDLWRAMRLRRGLSLEDVAHALQVSSRTIRRWENAQTAVPEERIGDLCHLLKAEPEERAALQQHRILLWTPDHGRLPSVEALEARLLWIRDLLRSGDSRLTDLYLMTLKAQLWPLRSSQQALRLLAHAHLVHSEFREVRGRHGEALPMATHALQILMEDERPDRPLLADALHSLGVSSGVDGRTRFDRFKSTIYRWQSFSADTSWLNGLYRDAVEAALEANEIDAADAWISEGTRLLGDLPDGIERRLMNHVHIRVLYNQGRFQEARQLLPSDEHSNPHQRLWEVCLKAEVYMKTDDLSEAQSLITRGYHLIQQYNLGNTYIVDHLSRKV